MKIVNKSGIPDALFRYLSQDNYDYEKKGDSFSATELLNPIQIIILKRRHWKDITVDAIDQLWKLLGSGVHAILETEQGIEKIERLSIDVLGRKVSGKWDRIFGDEITDYKVTSAWTMVYGSREHEWRLQLSIYRYLYHKCKGVFLRPHGYIVALLRDWAARDAKKMNYPKAPAVQVKLELLSIEDTEAFITGRIKAIIEAEALPDAKLPECSDEDRWYNATKKTYMRCAKYCEVAKFCGQLAREKARESVELAEVVGAEE